MRSCLSGNLANLRPGRNVNVNIGELLLKCPCVIWLAAIPSSSLLDRHVLKLVLCCAAQYGSRWPCVVIYISVN